VGTAVDLRVGELLAPAADRHFVGQTGCGIFQVILQERSGVIHGSCPRADRSTGTVVAARCPAPFGRAPRGEAVSRAPSRGPCCRRSTAAPRSRSHGTFV